MTTAKRSKLRDRVVRAAEATLASEGVVSMLDVLLCIGWLDQTSLKRWRQAQLPSLEAAIQANRERVAEAEELFHAWASEKLLQPGETAYVARTAARTPLRFTTSGDDAIERLYRTHWVSPELSTTKRARIEEALNRAPELVVVQPLDEDWKCHRCGGSGDLLTMEASGPSCLACAGLGAFVFLPAGDAGRSRRAKARSSVHAVVVRFSRTRKRYERQGLLVQAEALQDAENAAGRTDANHFEGPTTRELLEPLAERRPRPGKRGSPAG